jgi:beta-fructofuranosidase
MYYTGSRFLARDAGANIETVLMATSTDLHHWVKTPGMHLSAEHPWYETLADGTWREEAWRDPWIVPDPGGDGWHMLVTARARDVAEGIDPDDRGVVGHARSTDLVSWTALPPLSAPGFGFAHLEVPQLVAVDGREVLLFSCDSPHLVGARTGARGGIWALPLGEGGLFGSIPLRLEAAQLVTGDELYAGRIVHTASGPALLGFENVGVDGEFIGRLSDPRPVHWEGDRLVAMTQEIVR